MVAHVRVEPTPNPNSIKLTVAEAQRPKPVTFSTPESARADPLARKLFEVAGVRSVFMISNFVTVTKDPASEWETMLDQVVGIVSAHFP